MTLWTFIDQPIEGFDINLKMPVAGFNLVKPLQRYSYLKMVIFAKIAFFAIFEGVARRGEEGVSREQEGNVEGSVKTVMENNYFGKLIIP